jgi:CRP/FNR family transcriptional regulator, cyclic AMP receptor protein
MSQTSSPPYPSHLPADALLRVPLFAQLDEALVRSLANELRAETCEPGTTIMAEGDPATEMFVIIAGELEVLKASERGAELRVAMLGPGDWVGEMALLGGELDTRSASVRALAPTLLVRVTAEEMERLVLERDPRNYATLMRAIARELSRRLKVADSILAQVVAKVSDQYLRTQR